MELILGKTAWKRLLPENSMPVYANFSDKPSEIPQRLTLLPRPMKKKTGTSAGIPRASGERNSPMANGAVTKEV